MSGRWRDFAMTGFDKAPSRPAYNVSLVLFVRGLQPWYHFLERYFP